MSAFCLLGGLFWEVCFILPNRLQWQSSLVVQQVKDLALSLLWHRFAAAVWVQTLAWELLHTTDALKKKSSSGIISPLLKTIWTLAHAP